MQLSESYLTTAWKVCLWSLCQVKESLLIEFQVINMAWANDNLT